jgi:hypothetical protein
MFAIGEDDLGFRQRRGVLRARLVGMRVGIGADQDGELDAVAADLSRAKSPMIENDATTSSLSWAGRQRKRERCRSQRGVELAYHDCLLSVQAVRWRCGLSRTIRSAARGGGE